MSIELLELAADTLGPLLEEVVFVGGASIALWITDPAAPPLRPTDDVDVIAEVTSLLEYERFSGRMRAQGFAESVDSGVICRWRHSGAGLTLDAMPVNAKILGFSNRWQVAALPHAETRMLPSSTHIRAVSPAYLLATKLEAFASRGGGDLIASRDFADVVALVDGRAEIVDEVEAAPAEVQAFLAGQLAALRTLRQFGEGVAGALLPDAASQARAASIVLPRLDRIVAAGSRG